MDDSDVRAWKKKGIQASYPMQKNATYFESEDGTAFVENGDKYVIPLSKKEIALYIKSPATFVKDFSKNLDLFVNFIDWLHELPLPPRTLTPEERCVGLLLNLYLFQRAMDHHYYHFDRYLVYQNYSQTPVGFWWKKLKRLCGKAMLIHALSDDKEYKVFYKSLDSKKASELKTTLQNIHIFEKAQEMEVNKITDFNKKEDRLFRTAMPFWEGILSLLKEHPELLRKEFQGKTVEVTEGHPLIMIRLILSPEGLGFFQTKILEKLESKIKKWL